MAKESTSWQLEPRLIVKIFMQWKKAFLFQKDNHTSMKIGNNTES